MARDAALMFRLLIVLSLPTTSEANSSAASRWLPGITCAYTCSVIAVLAWPRRSLTTLTGTPFASSSVA
jgi:hypothetical protein